MGRSSVVHPLSSHAHTAHMSMYVTVLSGALEVWDSDLDDEGLLD